MARSQSERVFAHHHVRVGARHIVSVLTRIVRRNEVQVGIVHAFEPALQRVVIIQALHAPATQLGTLQRSVGIVLIIRIAVPHVAVAGRTNVSQAVVGIVSGAIDKPVHGVLLVENLVHLSAKQVEIDALASIEMLQLEKEQRPFPTLQLIHLARTRHTHRGERGNVFPI